ncbi:hypothetical protein T12_3062 [Trichinella patagoniensis]|uniref:Uncharacterized protein n=1 Tax=Trichinella patagoniensis TaxID=990121 RepID=A0A0V0ZI02_9BILA|nr:hypothetical protein T12_3062 [Trichinella patagoniensis]
MLFFYRVLVIVAHRSPSYRFEICQLLKKIAFEKQASFLRVTIFNTAGRKQSSRFFLQEILYSLKLEPFLSILLLI